MDLYAVKNLYGDMKNASHRVRTVVPQRVIVDNEDSRLSMNLQLFVHLRRFGSVRYAGLGFDLFVNCLQRDVPAHRLDGADARIILRLPAA